jgi:hypothetical protein
MEREESEVKALSESRFSSIIFLFRLAGIPFKMKKMSTIYAIYMIAVNFCATTTSLGMLVDVYINRDDMGHVMTNIRVLFAMVDVVWLYFSCR